MTQPWLGPLQHGELEVFARAGGTSSERSPGREAQGFAVALDPISQGNNAKARPVSSSHPLVSVSQWALPIF